MESSITSLSLRLRDIEQALLGPIGLDGLESGTTLASMVTDVENQLRSLTLAHENFNQVYNELNKLKKQIKIGDDDLFHNSVHPFLTSVDDDDTLVSKFEDVLAFEDEIRMDAESSDQIQQLKSALDLPHIHQTAAHTDTLSQLKEKLAILRLQTDTNNTQTARLRALYDRWQAELVRQVEEFGKQLAQLEQQKEDEKEKA